MNTYHVTIKASVTKTMGIKANSPKEAEELAHQEFTVERDSYDEHYNQETIAVDEDEHAPTPS